MGTYTTCPQCMHTSTSGSENMQYTWKNKWLKSHVYAPYIMQMCCPSLSSLNGRSSIAYYGKFINHPSPKWSTQSLLASHILIHLSDIWRIILNPKYSPQLPQPPRQNTKILPLVHFHHCSPLPKITWRAGGYCSRWMVCGCCTFRFLCVTETDIVVAQEPWHQHQTSHHN